MLDPEGEEKKVVGDIFFFFCFWVCLFRFLGYHRGGGWDKHWNAMASHTHTLEGGGGGHVNLDIGKGPLGIMDIPLLRLMEILFTQGKRSWTDGGSFLSFFLFPLVIHCPLVRKDDNNNRPFDSPRYVFPLSAWVFSSLSCWLARTHPKFEQATSIFASLPGWVDTRSTC